MFAFNAKAGTLATDVEFNDQFLQRPGMPHIDVSRYDQGNPALPGVYQADLYVNQTWLGRTQVTLKQVGSGDNDAQPCFDRSLLERVGVDLSKLTESARTLLAGDSGKESGVGTGACVPINRFITEATSSFDNGEQRLDVSVPQASMNRQARGYVDPRYWDEGVPAALLQYNANVYQSEAQGFSSTQGYVGINAGANFGPWRFRHNGNLTTDSATGTHYQSVQTSLERSITSLKSQLVLGEAFTDGTMFDSVGFRGIRLATDDRMYPESQRGYAPTIHGIANSNALVQVRQNGNIIYTANVSAGPFEITDLYPTGYGGDLDVRVTEADGSIHVFKVPYAAAVNAVRPGVTRFSLTAGQYHDPQSSIKPMLFQGTVQHGFTNMITGYGGVIAAEGYAAAVIGTALNTDIGAFGLDITQASTNLPNQPGRNGQSVRISYTKLVSPTNTNISVAAYRYSSSGYLGLQDAMQLRDINERGMGNLLGNDIQRGLFQVTINQTLPKGFGSFYLTGSTQNYWNRNGSDTQFQAGYNNNFKRINYGVSISRQYDLTLTKWDNSVMLTVGIPLGIGSHAPYLSSNLQHDSNGATTSQESMSGVLGEDSEVTYGMNAGYNGGARMADTTTVGGNATYVSPIATLMGNASSGTGFRQFGVGASGGVIAYGGGIAFASTMGGTVGIVEAKGADGAHVTNSSGLRIDSWGHAIVSNLLPFEDNEIEIDPKGLPMSVELKSSSEHTAPTAGAIVRLKFETEGGGRAVLMRAKSADGQPLPFGAQVSDATGASVGTVAQAGRIVLRSLKSDNGELYVKWGAASDQQCKLAYLLPKASGGKAVTWTTVNALCSK